MTIENQIKAYKEILKVAKKHETDIDRNYVSVSQLQDIIRNLEISQRFGIPLRFVGCSNGGYMEAEGGYDSWTGILFCNGGDVGCSGNGSQPPVEGEWLFRISFGCGPYIFASGTDIYPVETFRAFFEELKSYGPAFIDTANKALYFRDDVAKVVYDNFWPIFNKYKALVAEEVKEQRRQALIDELAKLEK